MRPCSKRSRYQRGAGLAWPKNTTATMECNFSLLGLPSCEREDLQHLGYFEQILPKKFTANQMKDLFQKNVTNSPDFSGKNF